MVVNPATGILPRSNRKACRVVGSLRFGSDVEMARAGGVVRLPMVNLWWLKRNLFIEFLMGHPGDFMGLNLLVKMGQFNMIHVWSLSFVTFHGTYVLPSICNFGYNFWQGGQDWLLHGSLGGGIKPGDPESPTTRVKAMIRYTTMTLPVGRHLLITPDRIVILMTFFFTCHILNIFISVWDSCMSNWQYWSTEWFADIWRITR